MRAERNPRNEPSFLGKLLGHTTAFLVGSPLTVVVLCLLTAALCLGWMSLRLEYRTARLDLLNPGAQWNQLWLDYIDEFGAEDDVVVVLEGEDPVRVAAALDDLTWTIESERHLFHSVLHEIDFSPVQAKGLYYLPVDELRRIAGFLKTVPEPFHANDRPALIESIMTGPAEVLAADRGVSSSDVRQDTPSPAERLMHGLYDALAGNGSYISPWPEMPAEFSESASVQSRRLVSKDGRMGFILLRLLHSDETGFARGGNAISELRELIQEMSSRHDGIRAGITGLPIMEFDEMSLSQREMAGATAIGFAGVFILFVAGFGNIRHSLVAVGTLLIGMAWACGFLTFAVGHLNILSSAFAVVLIGLGINFPIHFLARYLQTLRCEAIGPKLLAKTSQEIGPGIVTGALTTAIAFLAAGLTDFTGVAELGIIAGGGILACMLATLVFMPSALYLIDRRRSNGFRSVPVDVHAWVAPFVKRPRFTLAATLVVSLAAVAGIQFVSYDHNLLNLQAKGLASVELEQRLLTDSDQSAWYAVSVADSTSELLARAQEFSRLDTVERTEQVASFLPSGTEEKWPLIQQIHRLLTNLPPNFADSLELSPQVLANMLNQTAVADFAARPANGSNHGSQQLATARSHSVNQFTAAIRDLFRSMPEKTLHERLSAYNEHLANDLRLRIELLKQAANPEPPALTDLPSSLVNRFVGRNGKHLLKVYARGNPWDMDQLRRFVYDVRRVDPTATGNPLQTYEASRTMLRSYVLAAVYAVIGIAIAIWIDFRKWRHVALALSPLALSMIQTFGLLGITNITLNPANMIALPLLIGLGVEDGVHLVHDLRSQRGRGQYRLSRSVALAVMLTSVTTIASFASLLIASHQGLHSLGRVMTLGVICCFVTSLISLPALFAWMTRRQAPQQATSQDAQPESVQILPFASTSGSTKEVPRPAHHYRRAG